MINLQSSYSQNNYGEVFEAIVDAFKPVNVVELGVLHGYSTSYILKALKKNGRGTIKAYDLFEDYPYNHSRQEDVVNFFEGQPVEFYKKDAFTVYEEFNNNTVDLLHVDLSNTGETVKKIMEQWDAKMVQGGVILFEGGTQEGDQVAWRLKYQAPSIKTEIETNRIIQDKYIYGTYLKWPGLTMLLKKR